MGEGDLADEDDPELYASVWSLHGEPPLGSSWTPAFGCRETNSGQRPLLVCRPDDVHVHPGLYFGITN